MKELTEKQKKIFNYIKDYITIYKYPPTIREINKHFYITVKGAYDHVCAIEKKGYIQRDKYVSRGIRIIVDK